VNRTVLVFGAAGFVGSALARELLAAGDTVVSVTRDRTRTPPGTAVVYGDVTDQAFCRRVIADYKVDVLYHLAAQSIVSVCADDPLGALETTAIGTARLLQAVRDTGRRVRIIVSTSDKVYGHSPSPYTEDTPFDARHPYEVSKACQDLIARMFAYTYDMDVSIVRSVNIYGPNDPNEDRLIPQTILRCLRGEPPRLHEGASRMLRQYVYIDDLVDALRRVEAYGQPEAFCVGAPDEARSVLDVMRAIYRVAGRDWREPEIAARAGGFKEIASQSIDDRKLRSIGWQPTVRFADGIERTFRWYQEASHVVR
jgi:CDP-glucose 4,6-dehydratase